jgi:hypothetical protein
VGRTEWAFPFATASYVPLGHTIVIVSALGELVGAAEPTDVTAIEHATTAAASMNLTITSFLIRRPIRKNRLIS